MQTRKYIPKAYQFLTIPQQSIPSIVQLAFKTFIHLEEVEKSCIFNKHMSCCQVCQVNSGKWYILLSEGLVDKSYGVEIIIATRRV